MQVCLLTSVFLCASNGQDSPEASPGVVFKWKNLIEAIVPMNVEWRYRRLSVLSSTRQHVATLQFVSCAERLPFRSNGASSSQGWRIRIVIQQPEFDPWVSHRSMPLWTWVFFCGCTSNGQDSPKASPRGYFQRKELDRTTKAIVPMNVEWRYRRLSVPSSTCQHVATLQFVSCAERQPFRFYGASSSQGWRIRIVTLTTVWI